MRSGHIVEKRGLGAPSGNLTTTPRRPAGTPVALRTELTWPPTAIINVFMPADEPGMTNVTTQWRMVFIHTEVTRLSYTECPTRNVPNFGRVFLMLKYTDITQNTYIQS